jgi:uncharacterized repeat protein (TIGR03803 family)
MLALALALVPAAAQNPVPSTARQAATLPEFASRLARHVSPEAAGKKRAAPTCSRGVSPKDQVIYENGPVNGTTDAWTINFGYVVSDSFTGATVTGFDIWVWEYPGDSVTSVDWSITSGPNSGTVYGSGTVRVLDTYISTNQFGYDVDKISATGLNGNQGAVYLNLQNAQVPSGDPVYWDENSGVGCHSTGCPSQAYENAAGTIPSEAFDISGGGFGCFRPEKNLKVIHDFASNEYGSGPAGVIIDRAANLYGAIPGTGDFDFDFGSAYELAAKGKDWVFTPLYSFTGGYNGQHPRSLLLGPEGALYGSASGGIKTCSGGTSDYCGLVYSLTPAPNACLTALCSWVGDVLYRFTGNDDPAAKGVVLAADQTGNLYGISDGTIFELIPSDGGWTEKVLHTFSGGTDGVYPQDLLLGNDGNLYGVTYYGGQYGDGTVFQLVPSGGGWTENILHSFQEYVDGYRLRRLRQDSSGNLFGIAEYEGNGNGSTVFMLSPSNGTWVFTSLRFTSGLHTIEEYDDLAIDTAGNLYVTGGGTDLTPCGETLDVFGYVNKGTRGVIGHGGWRWDEPVYFWDEYFDAGGPMALDAQGNLYGTTYDCGAYGNGTVWQLSP